MPANGFHRQFSVFSDLSKKIRGEAERCIVSQTTLLLFYASFFFWGVILICFVCCCSNPEFQRTVKELQEKAQELNGVKEDLKVR